jgi:general secretion pathway protein K
MAAEGQYTDIQQQHIGDYLAGTGQYSQQGQQWFQNGSTLSSIAGLGGSAANFGTTITALRILVTVHDGRSQYRIEAVVAPKGGAGINQTNATNPNATTAATPAAATPLTSTAQPSSTATSASTAAAASQSINYPFTLLEMLEEDDIPQLPTPPAEPKT